MCPCILVVVGITACTGHCKLLYFVEEMHVKYLAQHPYAIAADTFFKAAENDMRET